MASVMDKHIVTIEKLYGRSNWTKRKILVIPLLERNKLSDIVDGCRINPNVGNNPSPESVAIVRRIGEMLISLTVSDVGPSAPVLTCASANEFGIHRLQCTSGVVTQESIVYMKEFFNWECHATGEVVAHVGRLQTHLSELNDAFRKLFESCLSD